MQSETEWLLKWFVSRKGISPPAQDATAVNYFNAGWVDSFGIIELIGEIEAAFAIQFTQEDFQDRRFATVGGLAEVIREVKNRK